MRKTEPNFGTKTAEVSKIVEMRMVRPKNPPLNAPPAKTALRTDPEPNVRNSRTTLSAVQVTANVLVRTEMEFERIGNAMV